MFACKPPDSYASGSVDFGGDQVKSDFDVEVNGTVCCIRSFRRRWKWMIMFSRTRIIH